MKRQRFYLNEVWFFFFSLRSSLQISRRFEDQEELTRRHAVAVLTSVWERILTTMFSRPRLSNSLRMSQGPTTILAGKYSDVRTDVSERTKYVQENLGIFLSAFSSLLQRLSESLCFFCVQRKTYTLPTTLVWTTLHYRPHGTRYTQLHATPLLTQLYSLPDWRLQESHARGRQLFCNNLFCKNLFCKQIHY